MHQGKKEDGKTRTNTKKSWKSSKERRTYRVSNQHKKRILIPKIKNMKVETITARKGIANVFAKFYAKLNEDDEGEENKRENEAETCSGSEEKYLGTSNQFRSSQQMKSKMRSAASKEGKRETAVGSEQNRSKIAVMRRRRGSDRSSTKYCCKSNARRKHGEEFEFKCSTKKGDKEGPICSLPVLYKLFATVMYARLAPSLHKVQSLDQGGFRPNHQTVDHLMVYKVLEQRCRESDVPLYISTIDFTKAFYRIKHSALLTSLEHYGIGPSYVELLKRLYNHQEGTVLTDKESDVFPIK